MKIVTFILVSFFMITAYAYKNKPTCGMTELLLKNCPLNTHGFRLHFLDDKILVHDGVWRSIEKLPLVGKETEWKNIEVKKIGSHVYVQLLIWTKPFGEGEVQNLKWFVHKVEKKHMELVSELTVQKRSKDFEAKGKSYKYDHLAEFSLKGKHGHAYLSYNGKDRELK